jgi:hypothetical protein
MTTEPTAEELEALKDILARIATMEPDARKRILQTVSTFFNLNGPTQSLPATPPHQPRLGGVLGSENRPFSDRQELSPKEFLLAKEPRTDVERVAVLAFYLTHYRGMHHFKTIDISALNTEAAQTKFSNAALSVNNATLAGFIVPATKGFKQLSALGEQYVQVLPDRDAAKAVRERMKRKRPTRSKGVRESKSED